MIIETQHVSTVTRHFTNREAFVVTFFVMTIAAAAYLAKVTNMGDATFSGRKAPKKPR